MDSIDANSEAIEAWNAVLFDKFSRFRHVLTTGLGAHGEALFKSNPPSAGAHVLDIGCGFGDTTLRLAELVGPEGRATGVDAARRFIETASKEAHDVGQTNVRFVSADVQGADLGGPFDQAYSRFGTMFFANPVAAMRNVRRSLKKGGRLAMVVWRRKDENPFLYEVEQRVLAIVPHPERKEGQVTCGPGPFSMASTDMVSAQLIAAGFERVRFERFDTDICAGRNVQDAIDFAMAMGPAGEILRLAGDSAAAKLPQVVDVLRELFVNWTRPDGVYGASSSWLVSADAP